MKANLFVNIVVMLEHKQIETWIIDLGEVVLDYPFGDGVAVYKVGDKDGKMFALIEEGSRPVRLSLKCDPKLAELLRDKYETVLPGYHLNKKHWNTIVCSGQLGEAELKDLIRHAYELVKA
jgi:predicted DNA-binding protein (MmcQ/YjbR family)